MSRHTLNDGITPDTKITLDSYDFWLKVLAPRPKLVGAYYKNDINWEEYERLYRHYLHNRSSQKFIQALANLALTSNITLLCVEEKPERCHRRLLAEECKRYMPKLELLIK
jgi:uncharacterized protein YeaO (DUF488 family)